MVDSMDKAFYNNLRLAIVKQAVDDYVMAQKRINQLNDVDKTICDIYKEDLRRKKRRIYTYADAEEERQNKIWMQEYMQIEVERFFRSKWYKNLCNIDSDYMVKRMKEKSKKV